MKNIGVINKIIHCNYSVINTFDDHYEGSVKSHISKKEADEIYTAIGNDKVGYLRGHEVVHNLAIVGEVDFNGKSAYIFNRDFRQTSDKTELITAGFFNSLKECYVFQSMLFSSKDLKILIEEYHNRGGYKFEKYHDYENEIFNQIRSNEKQAFRNEIVKHIFKHQYQETKKLTWSNGKIKIKQVLHNCISINQPLVKSIMDLDIDINYKVELNSIFGNYYRGVNILNDGIISLPCQSKINTHSFTVFTVEKLNQ